MKEIYKIILELTSKNKWDIIIITITPGGEMINHIVLEVSISLKARETLFE